MASSDSFFFFLDRTKTVIGTITTNAIIKPIVRLGIIRKRANFKVSNAISDMTFELRIALSGQQSEIRINDQIDPNIG
jgi:hypothetical protein